MELTIKNLRKTSIVIKRRAPVARLIVANINYGNAKFVCNFSNLEKTMKEIQEEAFGSVHDFENDLDKADGENKNKK